MAGMAVSPRLRGRHGLTLVAAFGLAALGSPPRAQADFVSPGDFSLSGIYAPIGVNVGAALRSQGANGLIIGGELSLLRYWEERSYFLGAYVDYLYDRGIGTHRVSLGPELGWAMTVASAGLDVGPVLELDGGRTRLAIRPRVFASFLCFVAYAGGTMRLTDGDQRFTTEVGALLKFPIPLATCKEDGCIWGRW